MSADIGFSLNLINRNVPLDTRVVVENTAGLSTLPSYYKGMMVLSKDTNQVYILNVEPSGTPSLSDWTLLLNASQITTGTLNNARLPSTISVSTLQGNGSGITDLNATNITSGTLNNARLPTDIVISNKVEAGYLKLNQATYNIEWDNRIKSEDPWKLGGVFSNPPSGSTVVPITAKPANSTDIMRLYESGGTDVFQVAETFTQSFVDFYAETMKGTTPLVQSTTLNNYFQLNTNGTNNHEATKSYFSDLNGTGIKVTIDSVNARLGIGSTKTSPTEALEVDGNIKGNLLYLEGGTVEDEGEDSGNRTNTYIKFDKAGSGSDWCLLRQIGTNNAYHLAFDFHDDGDDARFSIRDLNSYAYDPDVITTRFTVISGGNVGINTGSPQSKLHLVGDSLDSTTTDPSINGYAQLEISSTSGVAGGTNKIGNLQIGFDHRKGSWGCGFLQGVVNNEQASPIALAPKGGNVGINTTTPSEKLDIVGSNTDCTMRMGATSETGDVFMYMGVPFDSSSPDKVAIIAEGTTGWSRAKLHFCLNNATNNSPTEKADITDSRMTIQPNGNVGIGITNPAELLEVKGNILFDPDGYIGSRGSALVARPALQFIDISSPTRCSILPAINNGSSYSLQNDAVDLGSGPYNFNSVHTDTIFVNGVQQHSDDRLKHNEEPVLDALGTINKLKLYKYDKTRVMLDADFNGDLGEIEHTKEIGFIAQEVLEVPELAFLVSGGETEQVEPEYETPYNLNYQGITNVAIQAIQELSAQVELLKQEIAVLKAQQTSGVATETQTVAN